MQLKSKNIFSALLLCGSLAFTSCDSMIFDDADDCVQGVALRFVYDYHMEPGANAFPTNVDCVNIFVFDPNGNYIDHIYETSEALRDESYRMDLPLKEGKYHLVVYGGLACENPSFNINHDWATNLKSVSHKDEIEVTLPLTANISSSLLHDPEARTGGLFYGTLDVEITKEDIRNYYREETVYMMKDTNNIQVILQEIGNPSSVDYADYDYTIYDDNYKLDGYNNAISTVTADNVPVYKPYNSENRITGYTEYQNREGALNSEDDSNPVQVACVEFSTSRLLHENLESARLVIRKKDTKADAEEKPVVDIPLITYLELTRGFANKWIKTDQEYLDRQSNWTLMFFLSNGRWIENKITVNAWTVRINDANL